MSTKKPITTAHLAEKFDYNRQSIYQRLARTGEFHGIKPVKALNGRLLWPADKVSQLLAKQQGA